MTVSSRRSELKFSLIIVSIVVYCLKILGLSPFSIHMKCSSRNSNSSKLRVFFFSRMGLAYGFLLSVLVPVLAGLLSVHLFSLRYIHESSITRATDRSDGILCVLTSWIIITSWTFNQRKAVSVLNRIREIDAKLPGRSQVPFNKATFVFIIHVLINVSLWITVLTTESVEPVISDSCANWFFLIVPSFVIYCFIIQYFMVVAFLAKKLETVNNNLSNFNELGYYFSRPLFFNADLTGRRSLANHTRLQALNLLHNFRTEIFEICHDIAGFFSFPILACVTYSFFSLIVNTYYLINVFVLDNDDFSIGGVFSAVTWLSLGLYPLSLLFFQIRKIVTEAKVTGRLVHKLLSTAMREEMKTELQHFSLRLLHENFDFTAFGFFTLDFTLLHSMLGATATYLVILIQFQK